MKTNTILFITGAFVTHHYWNDWKIYFENHGYLTFAPPWPYKDATAHELRARQPNDIDLARLTLAEIIEYFADYTRDLAQKPIIIGHSLGGLITQILLNRDLAAAGVAIHSVPPQGIIPYEFSFLKPTWGALGLFSSLEETYLMPFETWKHAFVNHMSFEEQLEAYDLFAAPESKRVARGGLTSAAAVDFDKPHAPLLLTSGSIDNVTPSHLNRRNFDRYARNGSILEYKEFPGRNHHVIVQPGWMIAADYILHWIMELP